MTRNTNKGFSLVEVLIALIVMSVGMLGIAGLYVQSMQAGRSSMLRHHAVTLAGDIADRIRANPTAGAAYAAATGTNNNCVAPQTNNCTIAEMAAHDILLWQAQAAEFLPAMGDGSQQVIITFTAGTTPSYLIRVRWDEPTPDGSVPEYSITVPVNPF